MLNIFTLTYNGCDLLTKLKDSLIPSLNDIDYQWFIKDNASTDNTISIISSWAENKIKLIAYKNNLQNFSEGCNLLFNEASPEDEDYILLLNNDVIFKDSNSIKNMIKIMENDSNVGVVGARLLFTNTENLQHAGVVIDQKMKAPLHFRLNQKSDNNAIKNRMFQAVTGAVLLTKTKYYKNVCKNKDNSVGIDNCFNWGFDDIDLCLAVKYNMEKKIVYYGKSNIYHEDSASLKKMPTNRLFLNHNLNQFRTKWVKRCCFDRELYEKDSNFCLYLK